VSSSRAKWAPLVAALLFVVVTAPLVNRMREARSSLAVAEGLQDEVEALHAEVDACLATRSGMELRLQSLVSETGRLREQVDSLEALDSRGVPAEQYEEYLGLVTRYNEALPEWERQAESLREFAPSCDSLVVLHNARADSLRRFLQDARIFPEGPPAPPTVPIN
jgi:phage shock protein A